MKPHFKCPNTHKGSDNPILDRMSESEEYSLGAKDAASAGRLVPHGETAGVTISLCNLH
jgi:hypothetical protein